MVERITKGLLQQVEDKLGLPHLSTIAEALQKFPDAKQLTLIKDVLIIAERLSHSAVEFEKVIEIIREINSMPQEKLVNLEKILRRIEKIIKETPSELKDFLTGLKTGD